MPLASYSSPLLITERPNMASTGAWTVVAATGPGSGTLSAWTEIDAATEKDLFAMWVGTATTRASGQNSSAQFDIGVGAAGSEVMIAERVSFGYHPGSSTPFALAPALSSGQSFYIPIYIAVGSRVAFRVRDIRWGIGRNFTFEWCSRPPTGAPIIGRLDSIGQNATATLCRGTSIVGGVSNAEGVWTELVASTIAEYSGFTIGLQGGGGNLSDSDCVLDIGIGASSSEVAIPELTNIPFRMNATEAIQGLPIGQMLPLNRPLPRGVRLSARFTGVAATTGTCDVMLLGWVR